ncbi:hypothetical protein FA15DRAFT_758847 [Coprinopsis marcescibilis]|uniref:Uncharacterized protein n=1 Tax=Coprinopsis marcescibilis TaxID=230819 RepID=A0A5C3KLL7_COPMA|nr:hypothetical protein FA15DRAFT_758847 [Coprinopsis marcescibilis]
MSRFGGKNSGRRAATDSFGRDDIPYDPSNRDFLEDSKSYSSPFHGSRNDSLAGNGSPYAVDSFGNPVNDRQGQVRQPASGPGFGYDSDSGGYANDNGNTGRYDSHNIRGDDNYNRGNNLPSSMKRGQDQYGFNEPRYDHPSQRNYDTYESRRGVENTSGLRDPLQTDTRQKSNPNRHESGPQGRQQPSASHGGLMSKAKNLIKEAKDIL